MPRHCRGAVSEDRLDDAIGHAGRQQERPGRMAQRVRRGVSDAGLLRNTGEVVADGTADQWLPELARKDEILITPLRTGVHMKLGHVSLLSSKRCQGRWDQRNAAASMLGLGLTSHTPLPLEFDHLLSNLNRGGAAVELHVRPAQPAGFARP